MKQKPMPVEFIVGTILSGQRYANDRLHHLSWITSLLLIFVGLSVAGNLVLLPNPLQYKYLPIGRDNIVLPQIPLSKPNKDDKAVVQWTIDAVTQLYSFDFVNYRSQLQKARYNMTKAGWEAFQKNILDGDKKHLAVILKNRFATTAAPGGAGRIEKQGLLFPDDPSGNPYSWIVKFPMTLTYQAGPSDAYKEGRTITVNWEMTVTVSRVGVFLNENSLGIKAIAAQIIEN